MPSLKKLLVSASAAGLAMTGVALADTIDPTTFAADLAVGESVTLSKTVVVEAAGTTDAVIDAFFLIDTSGSMGSTISGAKAAAADIASALAGFGDSFGGVGVFSEAALEGPGDGSDASTAFNQDLADLDDGSTDFTDAINAVTLGDPDGGGDFPERANTAIAIAAESASWRPGSNRFIFAFSDASSKGLPDADVIAALAAEDITLVSIDVGFGAFTDDMEELGAITFSGGTSAAAIVAAITDGITAGFADYSTVTVDDLGNGLPFIDVSTVCTGADVGTCVGSDAVGDYDRSEDRTFTFDVTFTRLAPGATTFDTYALVDGGIVAREVDTFPDGEIPLPAAAWMFMAGLGGLAAARRRKAA